MAFTYAELKQALQDYCENDETSFVNNLPLFIRLAEERILKNVQLTLFRKNVAGTMTTGNQYLAVPSDFLAPMSLSYTSGGEANFLLYKDVDFVQTYNPDPTTTGAPQYYAFFDVDNFILGPTPDTDFVVDLHYYYRPTSLTSGAEDGTTWLSKNAELALLYAALIECYIYMKGEQDVMAMYQSRLTEALSRLKNLGESQEVTDEYVTGKVLRGKT